MKKHANYNLSDEVISHVAKLLQMAILSGTEVVDHLRLIRVCESTEKKGNLVLTPDYREIADNQVEKMLLRAQVLQEESFRLQPYVPYCAKQLLCVYCRKENHVQLHLLPQRIMILLFLKLRHLLQFHFFNFASAYFTT